MTGRDAWPVRSIPRVRHGGHGSCPDAGTPGPERTRGPTAPRSRIAPPASPVACRMARRARASAIGLRQHQRSATKRMRGRRGALLIASGSTIPSRRISKRSRPTATRRGLSRDASPAVEQQCRRLGARGRAGSASSWRPPRPSPQGQTPATGQIVPRRSRRRPRDWGSARLPIRPGPGATRSPEDVPAARRRPHDRL